MHDRLLFENFRILQALYEHAPYEIHVWKVLRTDDGAIRGWRLIDANPAALNAWQRSLDDVVDRTNEELFSGSNSTELFLPTVERIFATDTPYEWEEFFPDTGQILRMISIPVGDLFISCGMDVSAYRDVEQELSTKSGQLDESMRRLKVATEAARIGIWEYDLEHQTLVWDKSMYDIYGVHSSNRTLPYDVWFDGVHEDDIDRAASELERAIASGGVFKSQFRIVRKDSGEIRHIASQAVTERGPDGKPVRMIGINIDETERRQAEQEIERLAYYDTLTGLPNRSLIEDRLDQAIARSGRMKRRGAVVLIDLDNFKHINDSAGHALGDELLSGLARRLDALVRDDDTVGRFGGDEFVIIMNDLPVEPMKAAKAAENFASKLAQAIREPFDLPTGRHLASASIGITVFLGPDQSVDDALRQADLAMYRAKASGRNAIRFFDSAMEKDLLRRVEMERDLKHAIDHGEFELHYQPQVEKGGRIRGAEALLRWRHPSHGFISPAEFIPLAEESGQIRRLGRWVVQAALADFRGKLGRYVDDSFVIAINVSALQLYDPDFEADLIADVQASGVDPTKIMVELTESALVRSEIDIADRMKALKATGIQFSLDDFGTGYSSLTRLKQLPITELKIDQSFVRDIVTDPDSQAIARAVIALADSMRIDVIAEGVETAEHQAALEQMGCHLFQGYRFGRPVDVDAFIGMLRQREASGISDTLEAPQAP